MINYDPSTWWSYSNSYGGEIIFFAIDVVFLQRIFVLSSAVVIGK